VERTVGCGQRGQEVLVVDGGRGGPQDVTHGGQQAGPEVGVGAVGVGEAVDQGVEPAGVPAARVGREVGGEEAAGAERGGGEVGGEEAAGAERGGGGIGQGRSAEGAEGDGPRGPGGGPGLGVAQRRGQRRRGEGRVSGRSSERVGQAEGQASEVAPASERVAIGAASRDGDGGPGRGPIVAGDGDGVVGPQQQAVALASEGG
jgi:hypothetical protein